MARGLAVMFDGGKLRAARIRADGGSGLTTAQLARLVGTTSAQIDAYEQGRGRPDPERISALAHALGIAPLELSDLSSKNVWTLAELRRAKGLRASDLSTRLGMSPRSYRRLETEGIVPAKHFGLPVRVAAVLGISVAELERHLSRAPGLHARLHRAREPFLRLIDDYVRPGCLDLPGQDDFEVRQLAAAHHRPAGTVARVVGHELVRIRGMRRRLAGFNASADFGASFGEQAIGFTAAQEEAQRIERRVTALPQRMDAFFRCMLPRELWRVLALLHALRSAELWLPAEQLQSTAEQLRAMPAHLVTVRRAPDGGEVPQFRISEEGAKHCATYRPWYDACYPEVKSFLQVRETKLAGHMRGSDLEKLFAETDTLLFSFDGLLCRVFAQNLETVSQLLIQAALSQHLPLAYQTPSDPVGMLRSLGRQGTSAQIRHLDRVLTGYETEAARNAAPLPGISQLLHTLTEGSWRLAVVTDHASAAVEAFLERLDPRINARIAVFGRPGDPRLMKPHPHGLTLAAGSLRSPRSRAVLFGESVADALAAQSAGIPFVGVAPTSRKARILREAGATHTVRTVRALSAAVRNRTGPRTAPTAPADQTW
ncbi:helix-turn-helix domain-containing protein [Streptomyces sp. NPDC093109]|uniref:helix-turn-helix domain-containing protein n=1 Tax=Streptomyces sp. NPDC093109 TaxID=3154977 RepID=UPI00344C1A01